MSRLASIVGADFLLQVSKKQELAGSIWIDVDCKIQVLCRVALRFCSRSKVGLTNSLIRDSICAADRLAAASITIAKA